METARAFCEAASRKRDGATKAAFCLRFYATTLISDPQ
jgi:hypothetical protein